LIYGQHGDQRGRQYSLVGSGPWGRGYFDLDEGTAREIAKQVGKAVLMWRDEAARHGLTKNEIDRMGRRLSM